MKILNCFLDNRFGGPQRRAEGVARKLAGSGIETIFLFNEKQKKYIPTPHHKSQLLKNLHCLSRQHPVLQPLMFCLYLPYNLFRIKRIIAREKIDIVHTNGLCNFLPALAAAFTRAKVLWHLNDTLTPGIIRRIFLPLLCLLADKIALAANRVGEYYFPNNIKRRSEATVLYAPVDTERFDPDKIDPAAVARIREQMNIPEDKIIVGAVGNINETKGYKYLVQAAEILKTGKKNIRFVVIGNKLDSQQACYNDICDRINSAKLQDDFTLAGFSDNIPEILSTFDVLVLSSVTEACPMVVLEAMAMRIPVVAADVGGVPEQIISDQSGIIVPPRRADLLADGILKILDTPKMKLEKMLDMAQQRAGDIFSLDIIAKNHERLYNSVLE